jgi:hypothetical protein
LLITVQDQNQEVRSQGRFCFQIYEKLAKNQAISLLLNDLKNIAIRKQIATEIGLDLNSSEVRKQQSRAGAKSPNFTAKTPSGVTPRKDGVTPKKFDGITIKKFD